MNHEPCSCPSVPGTLQYSTKNWSKRFECPRCGRIGRFNTNFLGRRMVACTGDKFRLVYTLEATRA